MCCNLQLIYHSSTMITLKHVYYEIHDEVSKNDKVPKMIYELELVSVTPLSNYCKDASTS